MDQDKALFKGVCCENNILKQCLKEKGRNYVGILKNVITQVKVFLEEVHYNNSIIQQQQQYANEEIERLNKEWKE